MDVNRPRAPIPIVDTHQHLWDLKEFHLPWIPRRGVLSRSYRTREYREAMRSMNVVKAVYMEVALAPSQRHRETEHILELCRNPDAPTVAAVVSARPESDGFRPEVRKLTSHPEVKGVRRILHAPGTPGGTCLRAPFVRNVRFLGDLGLSFDLCMRPKELADGAKLAALCPDTRFVVDHCGNADPKAFMRRPPGKPWHDAASWKRNMAALAGRRNVICKISGIVARAPKGRWTPDHLAPIIDF